jgi:hypothetical protein
VTPETVLANADAALATSRLVDCSQGEIITPETASDIHTVLQSRAALIAELERVSRNRDMWKGQVERQAVDLTAFREVLTDIAVYGCGMLSQPAAMNGPNELWLERRIREYERRANDALKAAGSLLTPNPQEPK